ncbi:hypothetical protein [Clostridium ihumii]
MRKSNLKCYIKLTINDEQLTMKDKTESSVLKKWIFKILCITNYLRTI